MENRGILNGNSQSAAGIALSQTLSAKKWIKDSLTRSYRRKQKQGKLDAEQEQE